MSDKSQNQVSVMTPADMPFGWRHVWIVSVSSLGQMIGTAVATLVSVLIPMIQIVGRPELTSVEQGLMGAMDLIGIAVGSVVLGRLSDRYGYLLFFRLCPVVMLFASAMALLFPNVCLTYLWLFLIGFAIGGEYSLDSDYVSELMPAKWRSTMVGVTKAASALGNIIVAGIAYLLIIQWQRAESWPRLMWILIFISALMILSRIYFSGSPKWLLEHGYIDKARKSVHFFLGKNIEIPQSEIDNAEAKLTESQEKNNETKPSFFEFVRKNGKKIILTGVPWACEGLGVYGIGVFLPILVLALGITHESPDMSRIMHVASSVEITFWISCIILPGFIIGLILIPKTTSIRQLASGFYLSGASLLILMLAYRFKWDAWISIVAFMAFELFLNIGPHLITYVLPPEVYAVKERSLGSGLAASLGKVGAVLAVFFIPIILEHGGITAVLTVSISVMIIGGLVTSFVGPSVFRNLAKEKIE